MKSQTNLIRNVELFREGYTNDGREITPQRLKLLYQNTRRAIEDGFHPKVKIGMGHDQADIAGIIRSLTIRNGSIYGDIEINSKAFQRLQKGEIPEDRSIEIGFNFLLASGEKLSQVITGVVFGIDVPALHNLKSLFEENTPAFAEAYEHLKIDKCYSPVASNDKYSFPLNEKIWNKLISHMNSFTRKLDSEDKIEIANTIEKLQLLREQLLSMNKQLNTLKKERDQILFERTAMIDQIENYERRFRQNYIQRLINERRILPAQRKVVEILYDSYMEHFQRNIQTVEAEIDKLFVTRFELHEQPAIELDNQNSDTYNRHNQMIDPTDHSKQKTYKYNCNK